MNGREAMQSWAQENFTQVGVFGGWRLDPVLFNTWGSTYFFSSQGQTWFTKIKG